MSEPAPAAEVRLPFGRAIAFAAANFVVGALPATIGEFLLYFWVQTDEQKPVAFLALGVFATVQLFGRAQDAVSDPIVGYCSDRWSTRFGRRLPWIALGMPLLLGSFIGLWYPPAEDPASTANAIFLAVMLGLFWWGFTIVVAPYLSLLPEICPDLDQRIRVSQWMGYFEVVGSLVGMAAVGAMIDSANGSLFETLPAAARPEYGSFHRYGYQTTAMILSGVCFLFVLPCLLFVRETGSSEAKAVPFKFFEAAKVCLKNRPFLIYVLSASAYRLGTMMVIAAIPFIAISVLGQDAGTAGTLGGITLLVSLAFFHPVDVLARRHGKKRVFLWGLLGFGLALPLLATILHAPVFGRLLGPGLGSLVGEGSEAQLIRLSHAVVVFLLISPFLAAMYVLPRPMIADVMDLDFERTGYRREAMYNGMEAVFTKTAAGMSGVVIALLGWLDPPEAAAGTGQAMALGTGALTAIGPIGGLTLIFGWWLMRKYPIEK